MFEIFLILCIEAIPRDIFYFGKPELTQHGKLEFAMIIKRLLLPLLMDSNV